MKNLIYRAKQEEYWDIWCEKAIVFPETMTLAEAFSEDNLRKLLFSYSDKEEYPTYIIEVVDDNWVDVVIYAKGQNSENCTEEIHYEFVEMSSVLVLS